MGIKQPEISRMCELFYRTDQIRSNEGLGLALAVVKETVGYLGGQIQVESVEDCGMKIMIRIPQPVIVI